MQLNDKKCIVCYCSVIYQKKKPCNQLKYRALKVPRTDKSCNLNKDVIQTIIFIVLVIY